MEDTLARKRVEVAIVTFGGSVRLVSKFQTAEDFQPPTLSEEGNTPMGEAIEKAIQMLDFRKKQIILQGVEVKPPLIVLITDGEPTDRWENAAELVRKGEDSNAFNFFPIGVTDYNKQILSRISVKEPVKLITTAKFSDLLQMAFRFTQKHFEVKTL